MITQIAGDIGIFTLSTGTFDVVVLNEDLRADNGLQTSIILSLFCDRKVDPSELPEGMVNRGWWGDQFNDEVDDQIGSRLWLLAREKKLSETLRKAEEYALEALNWLTRDGVAQKVEATAEWTPNNDLSLEIRLKQPSGQKSFQFRSKWNDPSGGNY